MICIQITKAAVPVQLLLLKPVTLLLVNSSSHRCVEPSPVQTTFEVGRLWMTCPSVASQVFVGGLDPSMDKETLEKLFGLVDGFQSIELDYDNANNFKVFLLKWIHSRERQ